jgi:hypothetical protein
MAAWPHGRMAWPRTRRYRFGKLITAGYRPHALAALIACVCGALAYPAITFTPTFGIRFSTAFARPART